MSRGGPTTAETLPANLRLASDRAGCQLARRHSCPSRRRHRSRRADGTASRGNTDARRFSFLVAENDVMCARAGGGGERGRAGGRREILIHHSEFSVPSQARGYEAERPYGRPTYVNATPLWRSHVKFERSTRRQRMNSTACRFSPSAAAAAPPPFAPPPPPPPPSPPRSLSSGNVARRGSSFSKVWIFRDRSGPIRCRCRARRRFPTKVEGPAGQYHF